VVAHAEPGAPGIVGGGRGIAPAVAPRDGQHLGGSYSGGFDDPWSGAFDDEVHDVSDGPPFLDIDYDGDLDVSAWYSMLELPLSETVSIVGGVRFESTDISTRVVGEEDARWLNPDGTGVEEDLEPGEADVAFAQDDVLPAIGIAYEPVPSVTLRGSYSQTVARQTFKELTPVAQRDFVGGPVFVGNPDLQMSNLQNYDLRMDYAPAQGSLLSLSWFYKDMEDPIEYVQRVFTFSFTQPTNYPSGELSGYEVEVRQDMGRFFEPLGGLSMGANATFIDSEVQIPEDEVDLFAQHDVDLTSREATNAPEYLYNLYLTYDLDGGDTQLGLFYTVQGDTLIAGAGAQGGTTGFVPSIYQTEFGTLNFSFVRRLGRHLRLQLQAKNLTDPDIETVYRSDVIGGDVTKSSYSLGREFTFGLSVNL
jgi:TonB-dependent receptor